MIYRFLPILKSTIWGGESIVPFKGIKSGQSQIGESWEISGVKNSESVVAEGPEAGMTLSELIRKHGSSLLGGKVAKRFGNEFPLLVKFIDARQDLSIQVHPNDEQAAARHNGSRGKTEMWYVVKAAPDARLRSSFVRKVTPEEYCRSVDDNTITDILKEYEVKAGDLFFLPAGCVHSIGAGCFIAEIQETSDITYRIYDFNRRDSNGNLRQLHTDLAKDVINYEPFPGTYVKYDNVADKPVNLISCDYFTTRLYNLTSEADIDLSNLDSFTIVMCLEGGAVLTDSEGASVKVAQGTTVLVSASVRTLSIAPDGRSARFLTASL